MPSLAQDVAELDTGTFPPAIVKISAKSSFIPPSVSAARASAMPPQRPRRALLREQELTERYVEAPPSVDLVVARYQESLSWLSDVEVELPHVRILVYDKSGNASDSCSGLKRARCIPIPNVGLEAHTYLYHLTSIYEQLADKTVFTQALEPTPGFFGHRRGGGHMMPLDDFFYDYLRPSAPPRYVGTAARFGNLGLRQSASLITFRKAMTDPVNGGQEALAEGQKQQLLREPTPVCPTTDGAWTPPSQSAWDADFLLDQVTDKSDSSPSPTPTP